MIGEMSAIKESGEGFSMSGDFNWSFNKGSARRFVFSPRKGPATNESTNGMIADEIKKVVNNMLAFFSSFNMEEKNVKTLGAKIAKKSEIKNEIIGWRFFVR